MARAVKKATKGGAKAKPAKGAAKGAVKTTAKTIAKTASKVAAKTRQPAKAAAKTAAKTTRAKAAAAPARTARRASSLVIPKSALATPAKQGIIIEPVHPGKPEPVHNMPFVPAFSVTGGRTLWLSGMGPLPIYHKHPHDPIEEAKWYEGDFRDQCWKTFRNIEKILNAGGAGFEHVIKITEYLVDVMRDQDVLNEITWEIWGKDNMPPRTLVEIPSLAHKDMLLEIDVIAQVPA